MSKYTHHQSEERQQLINEMMQFLLQRQEPRFSKQLQAQLLDEGCNYPMVLAKPRFYELMVLGLGAHLNPVAKRKLDKRILPDFSSLSHIQFSDTMNYFVSHLKNCEEQMAMAVINSIVRIIDEWKLDPAFFSGEQKEFNAHLRAVVRKFAKASASSRLAGIPVNQIRRRLYIALTTSLYRFDRSQQKFQLEFGSIPAVLRAMRTDHSMFCRIMVYFGDQTPYFSHAASQTFWRTLQSLNTDHLPQEPQACTGSGPIYE
ncbi:MAG: hypothetical protein PVF37_11610 [Desulfobacterales bacterium]|jgi:hypothetical protein